MRPCEILLRDVADTHQNWEMLRDFQSKGLKRRQLNYKSGKYHGESNSAFRDLILTPVNFNGVIHVQSVKSKMGFPLVSNF